MSAQYFIAQTVQDNQYVVLLANKVVAGPFASVAEAVKAREGLGEHSGDDATPSLTGL